MANAKKDIKALDRRVPPGSLQSAAQTAKEQALTEEAERIKRQIENGDFSSENEDASSPAEEAEREARGIETDLGKLAVEQTRKEMGGKPPKPIWPTEGPEISRELIAPNGEPINSAALEKQAALLQAQAKLLREKEQARAAISPSLSLLDATHNIYLDFLKRTKDSATALHLLHACAIFDVSVSLGAIAAALRTQTPIMPPRRKRRADAKSAPST